MHGLHGTSFRRRIILAEFLGGAIGGITIGLFLLLSGSSSGGVLVVGAWALGIGLNYVPLALHAISLSRPPALEQELAGVDVPAALRRYTKKQLWVFVPGLLVVFGALRLGTP